MKIAILGAGISGLSLFDILNRKYKIECDIYEKEASVGGLCRTEIINGYVYDLSGGHIFNSKYNDVKEYVFSLLHKSKWQFSRRNSKIMFDEKIIVDYPFEFSLSQLPIDIEVECIEGLYNRNRYNNAVNNFGEFLKSNFGDGIYKYYLRPYNEKIWKTSLENMDFDWIDGKMPHPEAKDILYRTLSKETNEDKMAHSSYYYPKEGGIQSLVDKIGKNVPRTHIEEKINSIEFKKEKIYVNGNVYDLVINTIPVPELVNSIVNVPKKIEICANDLKYNSVLSYIYSVDKENDWSWTYIPQKKIIPHRIVYQGNFAENNCPSGKTSITVEITKPSLYEEKNIVKNIKDNLHLDSPISKHLTKYAYVIFDKNRKKNIEIIKKYFNSKNVLMHGRFAEWIYPNMDICIKNSIDLAENLALNIVK